MSDNNSINPGSITSGEPAQHAPYLCPHCSCPADQIMCSLVYGLAVLWHFGCKKVLSVQLLAIPQQAQPRVIPASRIISG